MLKMDNGQTTDPQNILNTLADSFLQAHQTTINLTTDPDHELDVNATTTGYLEDSYPQDTKLTSPGEVHAIIRKLRPRKAPGPDNISNHLLKKPPTQNNCPTDIPLQCMPYTLILSHLLEIRQNHLLPQTQQKQTAPSKLPSH